MRGRGAVVPSPLGSLGSRLVGCAQTSSERNGCQACLSPWSQEEDGQSAQLKPSFTAPSHPTYHPSPHAQVPISPKCATLRSHRRPVERSGERVLGKALRPWGSQRGGRRRREPSGEAGLGPSSGRPWTHSPLLPRRGPEGRSGGGGGEGVQTQRMLRKGEIGQPLAAKPRGRARIKMHSRGGGVGGPNLMSTGPEVKRDRPGGEGLAPK